VDSKKGNPQISQITQIKKKQEQHKKTAPFLRQVFLHLRNLRNLRICFVPRGSDKPLPHLEN
jgi:hypothetical protein